MNQWHHRGQVYLDVRVFLRHWFLLWHFVFFASQVNCIFHRFLWQELCWLACGEPIWLMHMHPVQDVCLAGSQIFELDWEHRTSYPPIFELAEIIVYSNDFEFVFACHLSWSSLAGQCSSWNSNHFDYCCWKKAGRWWQEFSFSSYLSLPACDFVQL